MWQFIVSGFVPGTDIQLNFETTATIILIAGISWLFYLLAQDEQRKIKEASEDLESTTI